MAAVAVVLDHSEELVVPSVDRRAQLRLVAPIQVGLGRWSSRWYLPAAFGLAVVMSVAFVVSTGPGPVGTSRLIEVAPSSAIGVSVEPVAASAVTGADRGTYVVQDGDSLWSIAASLVASSEVQSFVDALTELNNGSALLAGQVLLLPVP